MADIKTRDAVKGTIKSIDKAAVAGQRMKQTYVSTKDRAEQSVEATENSANEYASDRVERGTDIAVHEGIRQLDKAGRKGVRDTKDNIRHFKEKRAEKALRDQANGIGNKTIRTAEKSAEKTIKQSVSSAGKKTIKTAERTAAKTAQKSVKTAKTAIKTTQQAAITERNRWMVTNTDVLVAYIRNESGGTAACVRMAKQLGRGDCKNIKAGSNEPAERPFLSQS